MLRISQRTVERYVKDQIKKPRPDLAARMEREVKKRWAAADPGQGPAEGGDDRRHRHRHSGPHTQPSHDPVLRGREAAVRHRHAIDGHDGMPSLVAQAQRPAVQPGEALRTAYEKRASRPRVYSRDFDIFVARLSHTSSTTEATTP
jgi:hypothetical protein